MAFFHLFSFVFEIHASRNKIEQLLLIALYNYFVIEIFRTFLFGSNTANDVEVFITKEGSLLFFFCLIFNPPTPS